MKFVIEQSVFSQGLGRVQGVVSTRPAIPVVGHFLIVAHGQHVIITATDMEQSITIRLPARVEIEGQGTIPAKKLTQIIRSLPNSDITVSFDDAQKCQIACGKSRTRLQGLAPESFPLERGELAGRDLTFRSGQFRRMLDKIAYSAAASDERAVLNGLLLSILDGTFTAAATDGRRLALMETAVDGDASLNGETILPMKAVSELCKLLPEDGEVRMILGAARAIFSTGECTLRTKLLEGAYPNFRLILPSGFSRQIMIPRQELEQAISRVNIILESSNPSIKFQIESGLVNVVSADNADDCCETVSASYEGEATTIAFNPGYLLEALKRLECNAITLRFNDKVSPTGIFGDEGFLYVIMPMRS
ncbi:MAG: polymerase subunit beta [Verrucomicrobiota bacterium]|jgi:DNA polymerase-3 subunit beta